MSLDGGGRAYTTVRFANPSCGLSHARFCGHALTSEPNRALIWLHSTLSQKLIAQLGGIPI